ncbi:MAG TPA: flagellar basal body rod protein FlgC [Candidatus Krumholzibacteria bacterium]|nr:flagellar basal body rod protein FlgC [Candidatus Krumholzibacteria bacterium]
MRIFGNMHVSASGLRGMRARMNAIAENIANVETTRTPEGGPYRRKQVVLQQAEPTQAPPMPTREVTGFDDLLRTHREHLRMVELGSGRELPQGSRLEITEAEDAQPFKLVHNPAHPDADEQGYVLMPNIDLVREFVDLISAQRAYEANVTAIEGAKDMFMRALEI